MCTAGGKITKESAGGAEDLRGSSGCDIIKKENTLYAHIVCPEEIDLGRRKNEKLEFRFYELPSGSSALAMLGEAWVGVYGQYDICQHFHNLFEIGYCHFGKGKLLLGKRTLPYEDAMISAIPANFPHSTVSEGVDSWEFLFFEPEDLIRELVPNDLKKQQEMLLSLNTKANLLRIEEYPELAATVWQILEEMREKRAYYQAVVRNLLKVYLLELLRVQEGQTSEQTRMLPSDVAADRVIPVFRYIDENYAENLRAADLARQCGLSEPHFRRLFEEYAGMTPMDYLNLTRIRKACRLLRQKDSPMDLIAEECGFSSLSAFTRNFKKFLDTTPYQWKLRIEPLSELRDYSISARQGWSSLE